MGDKPPFLPIGTEVSSRFKGAYCESKVVRIEKKLKVKINLKQAPFGFIHVEDSELPNADIVVGKLVDVQVDRKLLRGQIVHIKDQSRYHVVFNDGDRTTLRRTQLFIKGNRHYAADGNLDAMPLTNPEAFSAPVKKRGTPKNNGSEPSTSRAGEEDRDEESEEAEVAPTPLRGRGRRIAAENAMSAIGDMRGVTNDTQSEESADDQPGPSTPRGRGRRRRVSTVDDDDLIDDAPADDDEANQTNGLGPSTSADASDSKSTAKNQKKKEKEAERQERARRKKAENDEKNKKKEEDRRKKNEEKAKASERRRMDRMYKKTAEENMAKYNRMMRLITHRKSLRYSIFNRNKRKVKINAVPPSLPPDYLNSSSSSSSSSSSEGNGFRSDGTPRSYEYTRSYARKKIVFRDRYRLRNLALYLKWRDLCKRLKTKKKCRSFRQWWRLTEEQIFGMLRNSKLVRRAERRKCVREWFRNVEHEKQIKFVVLHENYIHARRLLKFIDRDQEEKLTYQERWSVQYVDIQSTAVFKHFKNQEWYPAILFPQVYIDENGTECRQRIVRNMVSGELIRLWEDDLVPVQWLPDFSFEEAKAVIQSRPTEKQSKLRLALTFVTNYLLDRLHHESLKAMLRCRPRDFRPLRTELQVPPTTIPSPTGPADPEEEEPLDEEETDEEPSDSDYDSDVTIKNATVETRDSFCAVLLSFLDARGKTNVNTCPLIQGHEVNLYYLHELALKTGNPRKVYSLNPWTSWGKKVVPGAVKPEAELRKIFEETLQEYITFNAKMAFSLEGIQPRSERKQAQPGQYSESRKKRQRALDLSQPSTSTAPTQDSTQTTPAGRGRGAPSGPRKRKADTPESTSSRRQRSSRNTTLSPGPSEGTDIPGTSSAMYTDAEDDTQSQQDDDTPRRKRKKSRTPASGSRRSMSQKDDTSGAPSAPTPKKGRPPKKSAGPAAKPVNSGKYLEKSIIKKDDDSEYARANILSNVQQLNSLKAWYEGTWYSAHAIDSCPDKTLEIMQVMIDIQKRPRKPISAAIEQRLRNIFKSMKIKAHYTGWNGRFDEVLGMDYLKVLKVDQVLARKRFGDLPNGHRCRPSTMAKLEKLMCQEEDMSTKPDYHRLALQALGPEPPGYSDDDDDDEDEEEEEEEDRLPARDDDDDSDRRIIGRVVRPGSSSEEDSDLEEAKQDDEDDQVAEVPDRRAYDDDSPELGEPLSPTISSKSSTSVITNPDAGDTSRAGTISPEAPKSPKSGSSEVSRKSEESVASEEASRESSESAESSEPEPVVAKKIKAKEPRESIPLSPELGVQSSRSSMETPSPPTRRRAASPNVAQERDHLSPVAVTPDPPRVPSKEPSKEPSEDPENVGESTEAGDDSDGSKTVQGLESESDEPEYPSVPRSPVPQEPPVFDQDHMSSAGSSNYPALSRQGSSTTTAPMPLFSPTTPLAHSGPLTLEEVPIPTTSSLDDKEDDEIAGTTSKRRRVPSGIGADTSTSKRMRRASERSAGGTDDNVVVVQPKRHSHLLTSQFSSGALTLEMTKQESSGPIEPVTVNKGGRRKTVIAASPTFNSSGPLTLPSPPAPTGYVPKPRPPGAPPLGRPKKISGLGAGAARKTEERDEPRRSNDKVAGQSAEVVSGGRASEESSSTTDDKDDELVTDSETSITQRGGTTGGRGAKRKRGGRFGGTFSTKAPLGRPSAVASRKNTQEESEEKEAEETPEPVVAAPTAGLPPTPSRDNFATQKARMAKLMEENGTSRDFTFINIDHEKVLRESPPEDVNINLEEMSNEARDIYFSAKSEFSALEKMFRRSEAARNLQKK